MPSLKEVKTRITSVTSTQKITKAMKMVAASKLRKAQVKMINIRPYTEKLNYILNNISQNKEDDHLNKFQLQREVKKVLIIVVTSDRGLCGAFNNNICKAVISHIENKYNPDNISTDITLMCIGKKGLDYFSRRSYEIIGDYMKLFQNLNFFEAKKAAGFVFNGFLNDDFQAVDLIYNEFKNVAAQIIRTEQFLPVVELIDDRLISTKTDNEQDMSNIDYIFEPTNQQILEKLIPHSLIINFYKALLESNAAEHGARMTAMDQATDNADDLLKDLKLSYNRARQTNITTEILEIVGGAEAIASN